MSINNINPMLKTGIIVMIFILISSLFSGCLNTASIENAETSTNTPLIIITSEPSTVQTLNPVPTPTPIPAPIEIIIGGTGDIMVHESQLNDASYTASYEEGYDYYFDHTFKYIKPALEYPDIMIGNLETVFASAAAGGYTGFPQFNSPDSLAESLKKAGFDVLTTCNNHSLDRGKDGLLRTLSVLDDVGLYHTGTFDSIESFNSPLIIDVKGIKVGILAGAYGYQFSSRLTAEEHEYMVSYNDAEYLKDEVKDLKDAGAQIIVASLHWGYEKYYDIYTDQKDLAPILVEAGVDIIFGHHPHILQPIEYMEVTLEDGTTNSAVICYSMGNFIANAVQRYDREGAICYVYLSYDFTTDEVTIQKAEVLPTYINFSRTYFYDYHVLPIVSDIDTLNIDNFNVTSTFKRGLQTRLTDIKESITDNYVEFIDYIPHR